MWMARLRSPAFEAWKTAAWDSSRLAASASRVIQYRQNAALWSTFAGWCIHTYDVRRLMTAYSRVVLRAENAALWYAWAAWKQHTQNAAIDDMSTTMPPVAPDLAQEYGSTFTHARMLRVCHILLLLTAAACDGIELQPEIAGRRRLLHSKLRLRQRTMTMRTTRMRTTPRMMMMKRRSWTSMKKRGDWRQK